MLWLQCQPQWNLKRLSRTIFVLKGVFSAPSSEEGMQYSPVSPGRPGRMGHAQGARWVAAWTGMVCAVADVVEDGLGRQTQALCISRPQSSSSLCQQQFQVLRSSWRTVFNVFTWNNEIKMPFPIRLQILAFACKDTFPNWECLGQIPARFFFSFFHYSESSCWNCWVNWNISMYQWTALEGKALLFSRFFISTASETNWLIAITLTNSTNTSLTLNGFCRLWLIEFVSF